VTLRWLCLVLSLSLLATSGRPARAADPAAREAQRLFRIGDEAFKAGKLEAAIAAFQEGYAKSPRPEFLLNLGQCYRALSRRQEAVSYLKRFIAAAPHHPLRAAAERTLAEIDRQDEPSPSVAPTPSPPAVTVTTPAPASAPPAPRARFVASPKGPAAITLAALSGALLLSAIGTGMTALSAHDACGQFCSDASLADGRRYAIATDVLIGVGTIAGAIGITLAIVRAREQRRGAR